MATPVKAAIVVTMTDPNGMPWRKVFSDEIDDKTRCIYEMQVPTNDGDRFLIHVEFISSRD